MLLREAIELTQSIGTEKTQILLEGDIIVPDTKPDMRTILRTDAVVQIGKAESAQDKVVFAGTLQIKALYLAKESVKDAAKEKYVHNLTLTAPIDDFIRIDGAEANMPVDITAEVAHVEYKMVNDRKVNYRAVVNVSFTVYSKTAKEAVVGIEGLGESQHKKVRHSFTGVVATLTDSISLKHDMLLPPGKPAMSVILQSDTHLANKEVKIGNGKISVSGELQLQTLYTAENGASFDFVESEIPFSGNIEIPQIRDNMQADVRLSVTESNITIGKDDDGEERVINVDVTVLANVWVRDHGEITLLEDAYHINKELGFTHEAVQFPRQVCRNKNQCPIKEMIRIDDEHPEILQIYQATGNLNIETVKLYEDRMTVEGVIHADILYIARDDDTPLFNHRAVIPFKQTIDVKGAQPHMETAIEHSIDHIGFNMLSGREVELRFLVCFTARVVENRSVNIITDIEFADIDKAVLDKMASVTVYIVQTNDCAWTIAKKFNTSIDDLLAVNEIDDRNNITPGTRLLILKS
ncbi:MAG: DUF3794 domain-containing protein [Defluviitaleaceae bacterium]|nr:DUF3794 domain-containing protein [Defluviitaleaceae bacterium]